MELEWNWNNWNGIGMELEYVCVLSKYYFIPIRLTFAIQPILSQHAPQLAVPIFLTYIPTFHEPVDQCRLLAVLQVAYLFQKHQCLFHCSP